MLIKRHPQCQITRLFVSCLLCVPLIMAMLTGCILKPQVGVTLIVSPESLDFGAAKNELMLVVNKNYSETVMGPLVIKSTADWLIAGNCTDPTQECYTNGPGDALNIPISIDRNRLALGTNRAQLVLNASGASERVIEVFVDDLLQVRFDVNKRVAKVNEFLQFKDLTQAKDGVSITGWEWSFGDGNSSKERNPLCKYTAPGIYDVSLKVNTTRGSENVSSVSFVTVEAGAPLVDFSASPKILLEGESVRFTQLVSSPDVAVRSQQWTFGDGGTSTEPNPLYTYNVAGVYSVSLTATTDFGSATENKTQYILVNPKEAPLALFSAATLNGFVNIPIAFSDLSKPGTAPIDQWSWNFGDGETSNLQNPQHAFANIGTFSVMLTVTSAHGSSSKSVDVTVDFKPPVADFVTLGPLTNPAVGESVSFLDTSLSGSMPIGAWRWTFGDGTISNQRNPIKVYGGVGTYTVALTVTQPTASANTATETKSNYINVFAPPVPRFSLSDNSVYEGKAVTFSNNTLPGGGVNLAYAWDFDGDGTIDSRAVNPTYTYANDGLFTVRLTAIVTRPVSGGEYSVSTEKDVVVDAPPIANFSAAPVSIKANLPIAFTDLSTPGSTPISNWSWSFGDGGTATTRNPLHTYTTAGTYTVSLTVTTLHSVSGNPFTVSTTKTGYITITPPVPPQADFTANRTVIDTGQNVTFSNSSVEGTGANVAYAWDFGDGGLSTQKNPTHVFNTLGDFSVSLSITTTDGSDTLLREDYITVRSGTDPLQQYVDSADPNYGYTIREQGTFIVEDLASEEVNIVLVEMTSQKWRDLSEYYTTNTGTDVWTHNMIRIFPAEVKRNTTMLFIDDGSNDGSAPSLVELDPNNDPLIQGLGLLAAGTDTVITVLQQVPNEPLSFYAESAGGALPLRSRNEDEIIAFTFDQYLNGLGTPGNETWPLLLPMTKSAVAAMDTVQSIYTSDAVIPPCTSCGNQNPVRDFFVTGGSKRGWTTWLTGAVDTRVKAIAPMVIDVLNMDRQMEHHFNAYGYWAPSIYPYAQEQVFDRFLTADAQELLELVDPFTYRAKLANTPKYLINSSGDQFFLPDAAQFYFDQLPGPAEKFLNYAPNTNHGLNLGQNVDITNPDSAAASLFSYYVGFVSNVTRPTFTWTNNADGTISVSSTRPFKKVTQWAAHNPDGRDFRKEIIGEAYVNTQLSLGAGGTYTTTIKNSDVTEGWTAVYIQVQFENNSPIFDQIDIEVPFVFTTPVRVLPENSDGSNQYPTFNGHLEFVPGSNTVIPVAVVQGSAYDMGFQYGTLMHDEINALLPNMLAAAQAANPLLSNSNLDSAWEAVSNSADQRVLDEITGVADGSGLPFSTVARANMVALMDQMTGTAISATRDATATSNTVSSTTLDWTLDYGLQDYPCVVMYIPAFGEGLPHANVTFAGLVGSLAGLNLGGIMAGAVIDPDQPGDPAPSLYTGQHVTTLNREILYGAANYDDILSIVNAQIASLFRRQHLVASDGGNWKKSLKAVARPGTSDVVWGDEVGTEEFDHLAYISYSASEGTGFETNIYDFLLNSTGSITQALLDGINNQITANGSNLLNVQYEVDVSNANISLWVSYAQGSTEAKQIAPIQIKLTDYLP